MPVVAVARYRMMDTGEVVAGSKVAVVGRMLRVFVMERAGFAFLSFLPITISLLM